MPYALSADAKKLRLAREFGADATLDVEHEDSKARIRAFTGGRGADVLVDFSAHANEPAAASLVSDKVVMKEITLGAAIGVTSSGHAKAIRLLERGTTGIEGMHTHDFPLADAENAIRRRSHEITGEESIHSCLVPPARGPAEVPLREKADGSDSNYLFSSISLAA